MKLVIRISTKIRSMAPQPRGFMPIAGLEHLGLIFEKRVFTSAEEFNAAQEQIRDPRFPNRGCEFAAYALTAEDEAKMVIVEAVAPELPTYVEPAPEIVAPSPQAEELEQEAAAEPVADTLMHEFTMDGTRIMLGNERVAGLFGDDKHLRVVSAFSDLRPAIEAWLQTTITTSEL
jgi:hypothetical protein